MKLSSIFLGLFVLCAAIIYTADNLTDLKIKKQGILVDAEIVDIYSSRRSKTMKVKYQNQIISKQIPYHYWKDHSVGEIVQVQFLEGERDILLPDEEVGFSYFSIGFLLIFTVVIFWGEFNGKSVRKTELVARKKHPAGKRR